MASALVCGLGRVGRRVARQLIDGDVIDNVLITDRNAKRTDQLASTFGPSVTVVSWPPHIDAIRDVDVVATALRADHDLVIGEQAIRAGVRFVSASDHPDSIAGMHALRQRAIASGVTMIAGCGLAPGCSDILAAHASVLFDTVDEVKIARAGAAGKGSIAAVRDQRRDIPAVWRQGHWREASKLIEQVWFPEPIGATECQVVRGANDFVAEHFGPGTSVTTLWAEAKSASWMHRNDEGLGAIRVEVWGQRAGQRDVVVYGLVDRVSHAAGALLGFVAEQLASTTADMPSGVFSVGALIDSASAMRALTERGVHAAMFEGAPIS